MNILDPLRRIILDCPETANKILLTELQRYTVHLIRSYRHPTITSRELADLTGTSIQNASHRLDILHTKGYLRRRQSTQESGGYYFHYSFALNKEPMQ